MDYARLDAALRLAGWQFDAAHERFTDGRRRIDYRQVIAICPGLMMQSLADYVTQKHEEWLKEKPREG